MVIDGRDRADRLLALAVRLLPPGRRDWGRAMCAESAAIEPGRERRHHTLGCLRVVLAQPAALRAIGYPLFGVTVLAGVLRWSGGISFAPLRWGVVGVVALLLSVAAWGRRPGVLGPVDAGRAPRALRAGGGVLVGALAATFASTAGSHGSPRDQAVFGLPIFTVVLTACLLGLLTVTAERTEVSGRALGTSAAVSLAAAGWWLISQVALPPMPAGVGGTVVVTGFGIATVVYVGARRDDGAQETLLAALCVPVLTPLLVFAQVLVLSGYGPAWLIPDLVPAAISPADDLENSRIEVQDPYVALLFLAGLAALILTVTSLASRRPAGSEDAEVAG
ncbi:hypothetical protein [Dactylosporangium sp. NPDC049140]|uniref:hypothetical protein n=1 Tax=Dactylosporangium sp. NPDC049140 TaxID=3155647 RepID=UPI0034107A7C